MNDTQPGALVLWEAESCANIACKVAVTGDFLPAMGLDPPPGSVWKDMVEYIAPYFRDVAISFVNLESPVDVNGLQPQLKMGLGENLAAPVGALDYLRSLRANVVGLANNHIYDYGAEGVDRTRQAILTKGMTPIGSGRRLIDAPEIYVWKGPQQVQVGFWAAANNVLNPATMRNTGIEVATPERASQALQEMKKRGATCCIVLLPAGLEGTNYPDPDDMHLINALAKLGFNVVAACHSHRMSGQTMVIPEGASQPAFCFYGLGSLSSGCLYSPLEREGLIAVIGLDSYGTVVRVEARPVFLAGNGWRTVPVPQLQQVIAQRFFQVSANIANGSYQQLFYSDMSKGLIATELHDTLVAYKQAGIKGIVRKLSRVRVRHLRRLMYKLLGSYAY